MNILCLNNNVEPKSAKGSNQRQSYVLSHLIQIEGVVMGRVKEMSQEELDSLNQIILNEKEWLSNCCDAPPLYEVNSYSDDFIGICMKCREGAVFKAEKEE